MDIEKAKTHGKKRSDKWPALRRAFLKGKVCAVCGKRKKLEAHHILPFHIDPSKELDPSNLLPLCEGNKTINCHLRFGHFDDFRTKYNSDVITESAKWQKRFLAKGMSDLHA